MNFDFNGRIVSIGKQPMESIMDIVSLIVVGVIVLNIVLIVAATAHLVRNECDEGKSTSFIRRDAYLRKPLPSNIRSLWKAGSIASVVQQTSRGRRRAFELL